MNKAKQIHKHIEHGRYKGQTRLNGYGRWQSIKSVVEKVKQRSKKTAMRRRSSSTFLVRSFFRRPCRHCFLRCDLLANMGQMLYLLTH